jgi:hypothetical protein
MLVGVGGVVAMAATAFVGAWKSDTRSSTTGDRGADDKFVPGLLLLPGAKLRLGAVRAGSEVARLKRARFTGVATSRP